MKHRSIQFEGNGLKLKSWLFLGKTLILGRAPNSFYKFLAVLKSIAFIAGAVVGWYCHELFV